MVKFIGLKTYKIDRAPKLFAAKIGFFMTILITCFYYFSFQIPLLLSVGFLIGATFSAAFLNYCLGCKIYALFASWGIIKLNSTKPKNKKRRLKL